MDSLCSNIQWRHAASWLAEYGTSGDLLIADPNTMTAIGMPASTAFFEASPTADMKAVQQVMEKASGTARLIAIGSGSINDITKLASAKLGLPYVCIATAPSMNGYLSANASITVDGHKKTLPAQVPETVVVDLDVLANAPKRLLAAGFADTLCRVTCEADWWLSHMLTDSPFDASLFERRRQTEVQLIAAIPRLVEGDTEAMKALISCLLMDGDAMTRAGGSYPCSQGEHMIAHLMEMAGVAEESWYHGEAIAVTTLVMLRIQEEWLSQDTPPLLQWQAPDQHALAALIGEDEAEACLADYANKISDEAMVDIWNTRLTAQWGALLDRLSVHRYTVTQMQEWFALLGLPCTAKDIGWPPPVLNEAIRLASLMRNRTTFLDLTYLN